MADCERTQSDIPLRGYVIAAAGTLLFTSVNVWTGLKEAASAAQTNGGWKIAYWEYTSAIMILLLLPALGLIVTRAMPRPSWSSVRAVPALAAGWVFFTICHVGGFVLLRKAVYAAFGVDYEFGALSAWVYEAPKDLASYVILVMVLALSRLQSATSAAGLPSPHTVRTATLPQLFAIREGQRSYHVQCAEVVAANAAGNYVEFCLTDGRRPLMRTTLAAVESQLADWRFVRTHRSWLVNPAWVKEISPAGGGDRRLVLEGGVEVPLSRRYTEALSQLTPRSAPDG